jgi:hypothetical protein
MWKITTIEDFNMKRHVWVLPIAFAFVFATFTVAASEHSEEVEIKQDGGKYEKHVKVKDGDQEYTLKIKRKAGKEYVTEYEGTEYTLRGDAVSGINADGDYVVVGRIEPEQHFIVTREVRPVKVERRTEVKEKVSEKPSEVKVERKEKIETK